MLAAWAVVRRILPSTIEYRGQKIKLTKFYLDYEDYKDDPDNIDPSETARVQRLVEESPIAHSFAGRKAAVDAVFEIKFPGYGSGGFGSPIQTSDGSLNGFLVEIPRSDKARYFIFRICTVITCWLTTLPLPARWKLKRCARSRGTLSTLRRLRTPAGPSDLTIQVKIKNQPLGSLLHGLIIMIGDIAQRCRIANHHGRSFGLHDLALLQFSEKACDRLA